MVKFPELYDLEPTEWDYSLIDRAQLSSNNFSPFFCNSLILEIIATAQTFFEIQNQLPEDISRLLFDINNTYSLSVLTRSQKNNNLKKIRTTNIFHHHYKDERCSKAESESSDSCQSFYFTQEKVKTTVTEDLQKDFGDDLTKLAPGKILIVFIKEISCAYSNWMGHATVLVIFRGEDYFWAFYCDSNGHYMPPVLRTFLEETFNKMINKNYINRYYLDYLNKRQQLDNSACVFFAILNANTLSNEFIKGASFEEIKRALSYQPSNECLREIAWKFFDNFGRKLCYSTIKKIKILISLIARTSLLTIALSEQEMKEMEKNIEELNCSIVVFKKLFETEGAIISEENNNFFMEKISKINSKDFEQILLDVLVLLNKSFCKYYEFFINFFEQKERETNCNGCKEIIRSRGFIYLKKREYLHNLSLSSSLLPSYFDETLNLGSNSLERLVQTIEENEEKSEIYFKNCRLCKKELVF